MRMRISTLVVASLFIVGIAFSMPACGSSSVTTPDEEDPDVQAKALEFAGIAYPTSDYEKRLVMASPTAWVNGTAYNIGFETVLRSGEQRGTGYFGKLYKEDGDPVLEADLSSTISNDNDHSTLLDVHGKVFMMSQFESRPAAFYLTELDQNPDTGRLTAISTKPVDFSAVHGGWVHCAGMRTPWKSHLGSEEYEPDARLCDPSTGLKTEADEVTPDGYYHAMARYFDYDDDGDLNEDAQLLNPYNYGYVVEATVTGPDMGTGEFAANVDVEKHYCMGRLAIELAYVMPDQKTAYITDDGTMVGLFKFVADTEGDLSAGTLYAAKLTQTSADNGGSFDIEWIMLGHATDAEIRALIDSGGTGPGGRMTFADIFDAQTPTVDGGGNYVCPPGYAGVSHGHAETAGETYNECLMLQPGMEKAAAFLETRRYAALMGATVELRKEEGVTFDPDGMKLYIAMSEVSKGMEENTDGTTSNLEAFSPDHIRLPQNKAGGVYVCDVDANYSATNMKGLVFGEMTTYPPSSPYAGNTMNVDGLANPDNVTFIVGYDTLIIGEDTGSGHQTDLIWSYNLTSGELTRIQTTPYGSETTSPYWYPNINGWGYLMSVVQHPYGESDQGATEPDSVERFAYTGYIGPFPKMD